MSSAKRAAQRCVDPGSGGDDPREGNIMTFGWIADAILIGYLAMSLLGAWVMLREGRR